MSTTARIINDGPASSTSAVTKEAVDKFARLVIERIETLAYDKDRAAIVALAEQAVSEALATFAGDVDAHTSCLPVAKLNASEVIAKKLVDLSPASLYRGVETKRFYCIAPVGKSNGREFPAWQFIDPAPDMLEPVLTLLADLSSGEVHRFWVTQCDELNELAPAEVLAGKRFETRPSIHPSQQAILDLHAAARSRLVLRAANAQSKGLSEIIS